MTRLVRAVAIALGVATGLGILDRVPLGASDAERRDDLIVVVGAPGEEPYAEQFAEWAARWRQAASAAGAGFTEIGRQPDREVSDRQQLRQQIAEAAAEERPLWLVLIGHGTDYRDVAKFNLRGPDVGAGELADWLAPLQRPIRVINCSSSSGPFIDRLSAANRVVVTATRSGSEQNFARFGGFLSSAIADPSADLDHDESVSLLEAFLRASADVAEFYAEGGRLVTEHALLDDNGDGKGTSARFFRGVRIVESPGEDAQPDGDAARRIVLVPNPARPRLSVEEIALRDSIEAAIEELRSRKKDFPEDQYYTQLERLLIPLARLYSADEAAAPGAGTAGDATSEPPPPIP